MNTGSDPRLQEAARRSECSPFASPKEPSLGRLRLLGIAVGLLVALVFGSQSGSAQSVWQAIAQFIGLHGKPEPASANVLSEHENSELGKMSRQAQAELLLERSINHYRGANDEIAERVNRWR